MNVSKEAFHTFSGQSNKTLRISLSFFKKCQNDFGLFIPNCLKVILLLTLFSDLIPKSHWIFRSSPTILVQCNAMFRVVFRINIIDACQSFFNQSNHHTGSDLSQHQRKTLGNGTQHAIRCAIKAQQNL